MKQLGAYEAKTHLSKILIQVSKGKSFAITKHGHVVALLVPAKENLYKDVKSIIAEMRSLRKKYKLKGLSIRSMIEEGRK